MAVAAAALVDIPLHPLHLPLHHVHQLGQKAWLKQYGCLCLNNLWLPVPGWSRSDVWVYLTFLFVVLTRSVKHIQLSGKSLGGLRQFICAAVCSARDIWDVSTELAHCGIIVFLCLRLLLTWLANLPKQQSWTRAGILCQTVVWAQSKVAKKKAAGPQNYIHFSYFFCYYYSLNDISFTPRFNLLEKAPKCSERLAMMFASGWHT